jgi:hypothetical protein
MQPTPPGPRARFNQGRQK